MGQGLSCPRPECVQRILKSVKTARSRCNHPAPAGRLPACLRFDRSALPVTGGSVISLSFPPAALASPLPAGAALFGRLGFRISLFVGAVVALEDGIHLLLVVVGGAIQGKIAVVHFEGEDRQRSQIKPSGAAGPDVGLGKERVPASLVHVLSLTWRPINPSRILRFQRSHCSFPMLCKSWVA